MGSSPSSQAAYRTGFNITDKIMFSWFSRKCQERKATREAKMEAEMEAARQATRQDEDAKITGFAMVVIGHVRQVVNKYDNAQIDEKNAGDFERPKCYKQFWEQMDNPMFVGWQGCCKATQLLREQQGTVDGIEHDDEFTGVNFRLKCDMFSTRVCYTDEKRTKEIDEEVKRHIGGYNQSRKERDVAAMKTRIVSDPTFYHGPRDLLEYCTGSQKPMPDLEFYTPKEALREIMKDPKFVAMHQLKMTGTSRGNVCTRQDFNLVESLRHKIARHKITEHKITGKPYNIKNDDGYNSAMDMGQTIVDFHDDIENGVIAGKLYKFDPHDPAYGFKIGDPHSDDKSSLVPNTESREWRGAMKRRESQYHINDNGLVYKTPNSCQGRHDIKRELENNFSALFGRASDQDRKNIFKVDIAETIYGYYDPMLKKRILAQLKLEREQYMAEDSALVEKFLKTGQTFENGNFADIINDPKKINAIGETHATPCTAMKSFFSRNGVPQDTTFRFSNYKTCYFKHDQDESV
jgi:hypothetical protein